MNKTSARILAVGLPLAAVAATGAAFAFYTSSGSGTVTGAAATSVSGVTLATTSAVTGLVPGGFVSVPVTATNPNPSTSVRVTTLTAGAVTSDLTACTDAISGVTVSATSPATPVVIAPDNGTASFGSVTLSMMDSATVNQDVCKGAIFTVALSAS